MGQSTVVASFEPSTLLLPAIHPEKALRSVFPVNLPPSISYPRGSLLLPASGTAVSAVQTITPPGSGTYTLSGTNPVTGTTFTTAAIAYNASASTIQAALNAALNASLVTVSGEAVTFVSAAAGQPVILMTASAGSVANTTSGARGGAYSLYAGSGTPVAWLKSDVSTDAVGNVYYGGSGNVGIPYGLGFCRPDAEAYFAGAFYAAEIPNLDANAISSMNARFITGSLGVTGAIIDFP